jgi:nifR3 family TIM-barrel protein
VEGPCPSPPAAPELSRPIDLGGKTAPGRAVLAPLSKLGNAAFREIVSGFGGHGLLFSEMCWAKSVPNGRNPQGGFMWSDGEDLSRVVCQIFGAEPAGMARAARRVEREGFFGVDINFGCAVGSVCAKGCGAALLKRPDRARAIVGAVRDAVSIPVFVKFRTGWSDDPDAAADMARRFEAAGADALTFHPRVAPDRRTRPPKWEHIARVKAAVSVPVFGNGDVFSPEDWVRMREVSGCDGVALGRLAVAKPWVFAQWTRGEAFGDGIYLETAHRLLDGLVRLYGEATALRRFHRFAAYYSASLRFGHTFFSRLCRARTLASVRRCLDAFLTPPLELAGRPAFSRFR